MRRRPISTFEAVFVRDGAAVRLSSGEWSEVISVDLVPARLAFYRRLRDRLRGRYAEFYEPCVVALEAVQERLDKAAPLDSLANNRQRFARRHVSLPGFRIPKGKRSGPRRTMSPEARGPRGAGPPGGWKARNRRCRCSRPIREARFGGRAPSLSGRGSSRRRCGGTAPVECGLPSAHPPPCSGPGWRQTYTGGRGSAHRYRQAEKRGFRVSGFPCARSEVSTDDRLGSGMAGAPAAQDPASVPIWRLDDRAALLRRLLPAGRCLMAVGAERIERWPVARLVPYARNARTHPEWQVAQIAASIAEFGFTNPILVGEDGVIIAGHGRLLAAQRLGLENQHINGGCGHFVAHALRGEGFDASEDGTGRGTPLVPVAFGAQNSAAQGDDVCEDHSPPLSCTRTPAVAFSCKDYGADAGETAPTLRAMGHDGSHANAGGQVAIATPWAVRRLTPRECERLQGFPDDWTRIPYRNKPADACPDGPRYKALGNSWAINCGQFVFDRIKAVEEIMQETAECSA